MDWRGGHLTIFIPLLPMLGMILVFLLNVAVSHRRSSAQTWRDARGVRVALHAELVLLRDLIAANLVLMRRGEEYLLSFRVLTQVYRSNVGRLSLLPEAEIEAVVAAYGATETTEVFVGAATKPHGAHAYRRWLGDDSWADIERRLREADSAVAAAILQLGGPAPPAPNPSSEPRRKGPAEARTRPGALAASVLAASE